MSDIESENEPFLIEKVIDKLLEEERQNFDGTDEEFNDKIREEIPERFGKSFENIAKGILDDLKEGAIESAKYQEEVRNKIDEDYRDILTGFDVFLELNRFIGQDFYKKYYTAYSGSYDDLLKLDTLMLIHARACQIAGEIRLLVEGGFADGAHARWRSLHELTVIFLFLYDNDYEVIQMYNDYEIIESMKKAREYQTHCERLGKEPLSEEEMNQLEADRQKLLDKYGNDFGRSYGWTKNVIVNSGERHFKKIEELVGKEYLRVIYAWASESVHGSVSANKKRLGLPKDEIAPFLPTSSEFGLDDPIQYTSYSLLTISGVLLAMEDSVLNHMYGQYLSIFQNQIIEQLDQLAEGTNDSKAKPK